MRYHIVVLGQTRFNVVRLVLGDQGDTCYRFVLCTAPDRLL